MTTSCQIWKVYQNGLHFSHGAYMSPLQKTVKRGGAMKNMLYACYSCSIHRDDLVQPNLLPCADCQALNRWHLPCYRQEVRDQQLLDWLKNEQSEVEREWPHLSLLALASSQIFFGDTRVNNSAHDPLHNEFQGRPVTTKRQHHRLLERELAIWNVRCYDTTWKGTSMPASPRDQIFRSDDLAFATKRARAVWRQWRG